jgi:hypothetical protein
MRFASTTRPAAALLAVLAACAGPDRERQQVDAAAPATFDPALQATAPAAAFDTARRGTAAAPTGGIAAPAERHPTLRALATPLLDVRSSERSASQLLIWLATPDGVALCPAELLVTDPLGRRVGLDPESGSLLHELPDARYDDDSLDLVARPPCGQTGDMEATPRLVIGQPLPGEYVVHVVFKAAGSFSVYMDVQPADWRAAAQRIEIGEGTGVRGDLKRFRFRLDG